LYASGSLLLGIRLSALKKLALQGLVGGISAELRGGKFQDGFVSAIISKGVDLGPPCATSLTAAAVIPEITPCFTPSPKLAELSVPCSGITAAAVSEVAHGGENNASEFTTTEQLAL
jgi:hypothetical protein